MKHARKGTPTRSSFLESLYIHIRIKVFKMNYDVASVYTVVVEYHTLYGVRRPLHRRYTTDMRLNLLTGYTVLGSISVYARRALSDEWPAA